MHLLGPQCALRTISGSPFHSFTGWVPDHRVWQQVSLPAEASHQLDSSFLSFFNKNYLTLGLAYASR